MKNAPYSGNGNGGGNGKRKRPSSAAQRRTQRLIDKCSRWYNELSDEQRTAWRHSARSAYTRTRKGHRYPLDPQQFHNKINCVLATCGRPRAYMPPPRPNFSEHPVTGFLITGGGPVLSLKLSLRAPPVEDIMLFASPPLNPGRYYCNDFRFLGLLRYTGEALVDFTRLYVKKFGRPRDNSRIFIRALQQVNGWEDRALMWQGQARVPTLAEAAAYANLHRARPRKG